MAEADGRPGLLQGDVVILDDVDLVVVSRSCDLPRPQPVHVLVAPLRRDADDHALRGWHPRLVPLPGIDDVVVDLTLARAVPKRVLPSTPAERGCGTADQARQFARHLGRVLAAPSHPDEVNRVVRPIWEDLRRRWGKEPHTQMGEAILDVRARFDPELDVEANDRTMTLVFVLSREYGDVAASRHQAHVGSTAEAAEAWTRANTLGGRAEALHRYCEALVARTSPQPPLIAQVEVEVISEHEFSDADLRATDPLRMEAMSP